MFVFISVLCHYVWRPRALVVRRLSKSKDLIWFDQCPELHFRRTDHVDMWDSTLWTCTLRSRPWTRGSQTRDDPRPTSCRATRRSTTANAHTEQSRSLSPRRRSTKPWRRGRSLAHHAPCRRRVSAWKWTVSHACTSKLALLMTWQQQ